MSHPLFLSQGVQRMQTKRPPRGQIGRRQRNKRHEERDASGRSDLELCRAAQAARKDAADDNGAAEAKTNTDDDERYSLTHQGPQDVGSLRSKGHADTDLPAFAG